MPTLGGAPTSAKRQFRESPGQSLSTHCVRREWEEESEALPQLALAQAPEHAAKGSDAFGSLRPQLQHWQRGRVSANGGRTRRTKRAAQQIKTYIQNKNENKLNTFEKKNKARPRTRCSLAAS